MRGATVKVAAKSVLVFLAVLLVGASAHARRGGSSVVVGMDPVGDWRVVDSAALAPVGEALGQDLVSASLKVSDEDLTFILKVSSLPDAEQSSGVFSWDFRIGKQLWRLTNLPCDPAEWIPPPVAVPSPNTESCTPSSVGSSAGPLASWDLMKCGQPRMVNIIFNCIHRAGVPALPDAASDSIAITVGRSLLQARSGDLLKPARVFEGGDVAVGPVAAGSTLLRSSDVLKITKSVRLP